MAKKRPAKKAAKPAQKPANPSPAEEELVLDAVQDKALKLADRSAKVREELEAAVGVAATKAVRKCMKEHNIDLTMSQAAMLAAIWFSE